MTVDGKNEGGLTIKFSFMQRALGAVMIAGIMGILAGGIETLRTIKRIDSNDTMQDAELDRRAEWGALKDQKDKAHDAALNQIIINTGLLLCEVRDTPSGDCEIKIIKQPE